MNVFLKLVKTILVLIMVATTLLIFQTLIDEQAEQAQTNLLQAELSSLRSTLPSPVETATPIEEPSIPLANLALDPEPEQPELAPEERQESEEPEEPEPEPEPPTILPMSEALLEINQYYIGWIHIPDTASTNPDYAEIDQPVIQMPYDPDNKDTWDGSHWYLRRDFRGEDSRAGTVFASNLTTSNHLVIFGHHMRNGTMFAGLERYKQPDFLADHPIIYFTDLYQQYAYQIVAVYYFIDSSNPDINGDRQSTHYDVYGSADPFNPNELYGPLNPYGPLTFLEYLSTYRGTYFFDAELATTATPDSYFINLQTCTYHLENARLVIMAIRIEP